ncbi:Hemolymph clottable protein [Armadillidium vulgare]|nr:Hemolymph clottable protein [Armadillidium vulgare]
MYFTTEFCDNIRWSSYFTNPQLVGHWLPTLAARRYWSKDKRVSLIRAAKEPSKILEFKYLNFALNLEIEFSNEELKVNGTVVDRVFEDSPDLRTIEEGLIYKIGHSYHIYSFKIPTRKIETFNVRSPFIIVYDDKIEIYNEKLEKSPANGICGNNDGRMIPELIGPKRCIYNDAQMFAASWTGQSDHCGAATLEEFRKGVDQFQADCKSYQKNIRDIQMNKRCLVFQWKISTFNETNYCISAKPLPFCLEKCQTNKYKRVKVTYKCWPKANAPEGLIPLIENKNKTFVSAPITAEPYFYEHSYEEVATFCKQF